MAFFYRYETIELPLWLREVGCPCNPDSSEDGGILKGYKDIMVVLYQGETRIERTEAELTIDVDGDTIYLNLSQDETALFKPGIAYIQVNIKYDDGERDTSCDAVINVLENSYQEVM